MTLTVRSATVTGATTKGSPLTHAELDENFNHLSQAANISVTQSGTGATSETVQDILRGWVTPQMFGAAADGTTDDTTAIQAAIDSLSSGGTVYFPKGSYKITASLKFKVNGTILQGVGFNSKIVASTADQHAIENATGSRLFLCGVKDMLVVNASGVTCGTGIYFKDVSDGVISNVMVDATAHASAGFVECVTIESTSGKGAYNNRLYNVIGISKDGASSYGLKLTGISGNGANSNHVYGGKFEAVSGIGVYILGGQNVICGVTLDANMATAVDVASDGSNSQGNLIFGCRFEGTMTNGIRFGADVYGCSTFCNTFTSGVTNDIVDTGGENFTFEPSPQVGYARLTRGHFEARNPRTSGEGVFIARLNSAGTGFDLRITTDAHPRFSVTNNRLRFGPGSSAADVGFVRSATKTLQWEAGMFVWNPITFTADDATPAVDNGNLFVTANANATTITAFDSDQAGHEFTVLINDANTTIQDNAAIRLAGGNDFVGASGDVIRFLRVGSVTYEVSRSVNS